MALVNYSDSESESEASPPTPKPQPAKPAFQKVVDRSAPGKIKVDLPTLKADPVASSNEQLLTKRARTGGSFSDFNSLLPPPKRRAQNSIKPGLSLKTSGEAAFVRGESNIDDTDRSKDAPISDILASGMTEEPSAASAEPKLVGKVTRFVPLSVANRRKKQQRPSQEEKPLVQDALKPKCPPQVPAAAKEASHPTIHGMGKVNPNPRQSLFIASQEGEAPHAQDLTTNVYEPLLETRPPSATIPSFRPQTDSSISPQVVNPSSLEAMASDLNLTPAQRRQLLGRTTKDANVAHFNMETEYAANEELRKAGEMVQHRAVKAIAPGKHSLQQLVNNARSQKDAMEDAWAEGRKNRGEGGSRYGWS